MKINQKKMFRRTALATAVSMAFAGISAPTVLLAEEAATQSVEDPGESLGQRDEIEELKVIGTRFQNSLVSRLDIPDNELAVTLDIIDAQALENLNFLRLEETFLNLPNVSVGGTNFAGGNFFVGIRGFQFSSVLINNRPVASFRGSGLDRSVVETVEVLKGPTSIVFGPVSPGGITNQVLKTPKNESFGNVDLIANTFGTLRAEVDLNSASLFGSDKVRGLLTLAYEDGSHPADEVGRQVIAIRPVVEVDIGKSSSVQLAVYHRDLQGGFEPFFPLNTDLSIPEEITPTTFTGSETNRLDNDYTLIEAQAVHNFLDDLKLTVRGSYLNTEGDQAYGNGFYRYSYYDNYDPNYVLNGLPPGDRTGYLYGFVRANSEEQVYLDAQLAGVFKWFGRANDALVGVTFSEQDTFNTDFLSEDLGVIDLADPSTFVGPAITLTIPEDIGGFFNDDRLQSVYAEIYLRPSERVTIPFGIRYDELRQERAVSAVATPEVQTDTDLTIKTGINFKFTDQFRAFYSYAESFVPQDGITLNGFLNPERGFAHEVGIKYRSNFGLDVNAAIFQIDREDVAIEDQDNNIDPADFFQITGGEQRSRGFELGVTGRLNDNFSINANFGFVDAETTEQIFDEVGRLPLIPEMNGSLFVNYDGADDVGLRASIGLRFTDEVTLRSATTFDPDRDLGIIDGYVIFDGMVGYKFSDDIDLQLNLFNLTDEEYLQQFGFGFGAGGGFTFGQPVNAQAQFRWSF